MGESTIRIDVSFGDGVYKSVMQAKHGKMWGYKKTRHIGEILVHPQNPDLVYVAAFGDAFGPNKERGVYRSKMVEKTGTGFFFAAKKLVQLI
ncbi:MAG: hypothetical protein CM1200mP30_23330 [Pseudomonadota bacterium]|nr:MAG: hypothetical protein CM1200mP30_23330 [Pseudomonadota bacterium]